MGFVKNLRYLGIEVDDAIGIAEKPDNAHELKLPNYYQACLTGPSTKAGALPHADIRCQEQALPFA